MSIKESVQENTRVKIKLPRRYKVLIYNDDFTPMDFVVMILVEIFSKSQEEAVQLMLSVHKGTCAVAGVYTRDVARTKTGLAMRLAREEGYPLKLEAVPE